MDKYSFKHLALKGGGIRGIAYLGALEVLSEKNILSNFQSVSGASAGAITALVTAMYYKDYQKLLEVANSLDFSKVAHKQGLLHSLEEVLFERGFHDTDYIYNWFKEVLKAKFGNPDITFKEFNENPDTLHLNVSITDISSQLSIICNHKTTPDHKVADIVRTSMDIPIYFEATKFDDNVLKGYFGDGGVMCNYPIMIWDSDSGPNPDTLGLFLYSKENPPAFPKKYKLKEMAGDTIFSLLTAQDWAIGRSPHDVKRSIQIFDNGINPTNFNVKTGDATYNGLIKNGREAAIKYFEFYDAENWEQLSQPLFSTAVDQMRSTAL